MNCFAKYENFLPHSVNMRSFMTVGCQMPELDRGLSTIHKSLSKYPIHIRVKCQIPKSIVGQNHELIDFDLSSWASASLLH